MPADGGRSPRPERPRAQRQLAGRDRGAQSSSPMRRITIRSSSTATSIGPVAGPVLGVDGVVLDRRVEPQAVALLAVIEGALDRLGAARCATAPAPATTAAAAPSGDGSAPRRPLPRSPRLRRALARLRFRPLRARRRSARRPRLAGRSPPDTRARRSPRWPRRRRRRARSCA